MKDMTSPQQSDPLEPAKLEVHLPAHDKNVSLKDDVWKHFRLVPWSLEEYGLKYWYMLLISFFFILILLDAIHDLYRGIFYEHSLLEYDLTNWGLLSEIAVIAITAWTFTHWTRQIPVV